MVVEYEKRSSRAGGVEKKRIDVVKFGRGRAYSKDEEHEQQ